MHSAYFISAPSQEFWEIQIFYEEQPSILKNHLGRNLYLTQEDKLVY